MKANQERFEKTKVNNDVVLFFNKWFFIAKILKLNAMAKGDEKIKESEKTKQQFFQREMRRLSNFNGSAFANLKDDLKFVRGEMNEMSQKISDLEYTIYVSPSNKC